MMSRSVRLSFAVIGLVGVIGCAPKATTPPVASPPPSTPKQGSAPATSSSATPSALAPNVIAQPPLGCSKFVREAAASTAACSKKDADGLVLLDEAVSESEPVARDEKLQAIEGCVAFEPGLLRALRADLAPPECADAIIEPLLASTRDPLSVEVSQVLRGLSLAARLLRTSDQPPALEQPFTRERFNHFLNSSIRPWYLAQSKAVFELASAGAKLAGYGKAIVAVEAGLSDLRFVENVRKVNLPAEMAADHEVVEVYQQALEDALDPRKLRGRDAILVGFIHLGQLGVLSDPRLARARSQLARLFAGSRIDALDALMLPDLPPLSASTPAERVAAKLPSFYADRLLAPNDLQRPSVVRALLERGLPPKVRQELERQSHRAPELARLFARGQLELGRRYFRPGDFTRASILLEQKGVMAGGTAAESRFVAALAHALEGGPENAVQLMLTGPMLPKGMGRVEVLDKLANGTGPLAGMSAFNAGHLLSVIPQDHPNPEHWLRAARYFEEAEHKLTDPAKKALAHARAEDARATAEHVRTAGATTPAS